MSTVTEEVAALDKTEGFSDEIASLAREIMEAAGKLGEAHRREQCGAYPDYESPRGILLVSMNLKNSTGAIYNGVLAGLCGKYRTSRAAIDDSLEKVIDEATGYSTKQGERAKAALLRRTIDDVRAAITRNGFSPPDDEKITALLNVST